MLYEDALHATAVIGAERSTHAVVSKQLPEDRKSAMYRWQMDPTYHYQMS